MPVQRETQIAYLRFVNLAYAADRVKELTTQQPDIAIADIQAVLTTEASEARAAWMKLEPSDD